MTPAYPQWPGFRLPFGAAPEVHTFKSHLEAADAEVPDHHTQLEELLGHVRRCERWARLDDQIDLNWRLGQEPPRPD
jgi:hypothetical protein